MVGIVVFEFVKVQVLRSLITIWIVKLCIVSISL